MADSAAGWNDPPLFTHTSLSSRGVQKSKLLKRPSPSLYHTSPPPPHNSHTHPSLLPQPVSNARDAPLDSSHLLAPPTFPTFPERSPQGEGREGREEEEEEEEEEGKEGEGERELNDGEEECMAVDSNETLLVCEGVNCDWGSGDSVSGEVGDGRLGVVDQLRAQLERVRSSMKRREVEEVERRLEVLQCQWEGDSLSHPVREGMSRLVCALTEGDTALAHRLHVALMVDHTAGVNQWMMGVKRLIAMATKLNS